MAGYPLIDPEKFFGLLGSKGKTRGMTGAKLDQYGYGQFANGVKHTIATWAPDAPPAALKAGEIHPEQTIHVRIIPDGQPQHAYFIARVTDEKATHLKYNSLAEIQHLQGIQADDYFAYHSPRFNHHGFVGRYENYLFLYYLSAQPATRTNPEQIALSKIREFDNHVFSTLRNAL
jgi:hypothetical protein